MIGRGSRDTGLRSLLIGLRSRAIGRGSPAISARGALGLRWNSSGLAVLCVVACACGRIDFDPIPLTPVEPGSCALASPFDASCAPPPSVHAALTGAALWLAMNETDPGAGITDTAGTHRARCTGNCPTAIADGPHRGFLFSGQTLQIDWAADLDGSHGYTVAVWARLDDAATSGNDACAVTESNETHMVDPGDGNSFSLCVINGTTVYDFTTNDGTSPGYDSQGAMGPHAMLTLGAWHHLALVWNAACHTKTLYVDGCRVNATDDVNIQFDDQPFIVGADLRLTSPSTTGFLWPGALHDFLFFDHPLGESQIRLLAAPP
jgi:hypothetical protein